MKSFKKTRSKKSIEVVYKFVDSPDAQQRLDKAFDILFEKVVNDATYSIDNILQK